MAIEFTLSKIVFKPKTVTLVSGYFDILHAGHVGFLKKCKEIGNPLVVGVYSDEMTKRKATDRPIYCEKDRLYMVAELKSVDYVFIQDAYVDQENGYILSRIQPKCVVYSTGEDNFFPKNTEINYISREHKDIIINYIPRQRSDVSTTQIIEKIRNIT